MTDSRSPFAGARKMVPTRKHRPAIWECMLGTVYADNGSETRYFDYDYEAAREFAGVTAEGDLRLAKWPARTSFRGDYNGPRSRQLVLYVLR